jgi:hypothetical protein
MKKLWIALMLVVLLVPSVGWGQTVSSPFLEGANFALIENEYNLKINARILGGEIIHVYIDWGDGTNSGWFVPTWGYIPIDPPSLSCWTNVQHIYSSLGVYTIKAKSRNASLVESDWSNFLDVSAQNIIGNLEGPTDIVSGVQTIYGWALASQSQSISKAELYIDDQYIGRVPYGGSRQDIKADYPNHPNAEYSGFVAEYNFSDSLNLFPTIKIRLYDQDSQFVDLTASVTVKKFHGDYASIMPNQRWLTLNRVLADGKTKRYNILIEWSYEFQGFKIKDIKQIGR